MSTVDTITPYETSGGSYSSGVSDIVTSAIDLLKYDERQKATIERYRADERKRRLQMPTGAALNSFEVTLKLRSAERFIKSAEGLGFKLSQIPKASKSIKSQPRFILTRHTGESLLVNKNKNGRLIISTNHNISVVHDVVQKHNLDAVIRHLGKNFTELKIQETKEGEYRLDGTENRTASDGKARIMAHIKKDGTTTVDVSSIKGKRCEVIIRDIARAIEGEIVKTSRKKEYFQEVEERGKVRV